MLGSLIRKRIVLTDVGIGIDYDMFKEIEFNIDALTLFLLVR
jgi:hypothetical protein